MSANAENQQLFFSYQKNHQTVLNITTPTLSQEEGSSNTVDVKTQVEGQASVTITTPTKPCANSSSVSPASALSTDDCPDKMQEGANSKASAAASPESSPVSSAVSTSTAAGVTTNIKTSCDIKNISELKAKFEREMRFEKICRSIETAANFSSECSAIGPVHGIFKLTQFRPNQGTREVGMVLEEADYGYENANIMRKKLHKLTPFGQSLIFRRQEISTEEYRVYAFWPRTIHGIFTTEFIFVYRNAKKPVKIFNLEPDYSMLYEVKKFACLSKQNTIELINRHQYTASSPPTISGEDLNTADSDSENETDHSIQNNGQAHDMLDAKEGNTENNRPKK